MGAPAVSFRGAYYWPRDTAARLQPFVSGGLTYLFNDEMPLPMLHVGGGIDWWTTSHMGLRFERREEFPSILSFGGGVVLR